MKKSYSIMPFPLFVVSYIALALCIPLFCLGRISLLALIITIVVSLSVFTFKVSFHIDIIALRLTVYKELFFFRFKVISILPKEILIMTHTVLKRKIDAKYGGGGITKTKSKRLIICDRIDDRIKYEKSGYTEDIESLGMFISNSLRMELKRKSVLIDLSDSSPR